MIKKSLLVLLMMVAITATFAKTGTLTGYINDSMCAAKGKCTDADPEACAKKCIKMGSPAVLVVGTKVYKIANQSKVLKFAGKKVTIAGDITNDSVNVTTIAAAK